MNIAVVTGAGRGLGRRISRGLAAKGYTVLATDIDADNAAETAVLCGGESWSAAHDVRDRESHRRIAGEARERGSLALWVNNAGVLRTVRAWEHSEDDVRMHVDVNVYGVIWGCQAAVDAMRESGGHIINMASISSLIPAPGLAVYGATKHAVLGFSTSLQGDLHRAGLDIKVSAVCPDAIDTDMTRDVVDSEEAALVFAAGNLLSPDEVARSVLALVDRPRLVTTLPPSRGLLAHLLRPFPGLGLQALKVYWNLGTRNRRKRHAP